MVAAVKVVTVSTEILVAVAKGMAVANEVVAVVAKVMIVMFKVVAVAPEVLIVTASTWSGLQWLRLWLCWRLRQRPRRLKYWPLQSLVDEVVSVVTKVVVAVTKVMAAAQGVVRKLHIVTVSGAKVDHTAKVAWMALLSGCPPSGLE